MNKQTVYSLVVTTVLLVGTTASILTNAAAGLPPPGQGYGGIHRINIENEPFVGANTHIATGYDSGSMWLAANIFSRLFSVDWGVVYGLPKETGGIVGDLAYAWKVSDDGLSFTFSLYQNATWSDGTPLTSADVVYTYNQLLTNSKLRRHFWFKNTMAVTSVEAPDKYTVVIRTSKFNPDWLIIFGQYNNWELFILPKHKYEGTDWATNPYNWNPVCSGPFILDTWAKGAYIKLVKNPKYYRARFPFVDAVVARFIESENTAWAAFRANELDAIDYETNPAYAEVAIANLTIPGVELHKIGSLYSYTVYMNHKNPILANKKVRQAIACAISRDEIAKKGFFGLWPANDMFIHEGSIWANPKARLSAYDRAKAEKLLDEAGYTKGSDGYRFKLRLSQADAVACVVISEIVKEQLRLVGIDVKWDRFDTPTGNRMLTTGDFDLWSRWVRYGPSPNDGYGGYFHTRNETLGTGLDNWIGFGNKAYDATVDEAISISDSNKRKALYDKAQEILAEEIPVVEVAFEQKLQLVWKGVHGLATMRDGLGVAGNWFSQRAIWHDKYVRTETKTTAAPPPTADMTTTYFATAAVVVVAVVVASLYVMRKRPK